MLHPNILKKWYFSDTEKMEGHCSTGQSPQWAVVPMQEGEYPLFNLLIRIKTLQISNKYCGAQYFVLLLLLLLVVASFSSQ